MKGDASSHKCLFIVARKDTQMKRSILKLSIVTALGLSAAHVQAAGFEPLPDTGFSTSAYSNCYNAGRVIPFGGIADNTKGNFGSYPIATANLPSTSTNSTCFVAKPANEIFSPIPGYSLVGNRIINIPDVTGGSGIIGQVVDRVWRNTAGNMCVFGTRVRMYDADHTNGSSIFKYFEVNDIARGGFANSGTVNVAYTIFSTTGNTSPVYRVGRTFTSVQHRAYKYDVLFNKAENGINYLDLPTKNSITAAITGEIYPIAEFTTASTTLEKQDAVVNSNWIDFTTRVAYADHDTGDTLAYSPWLYIEAPCDSSPPTTWVKTGAIRLRQTGQEVTSLKEISLDGFAPPNASIP